MQSFLQLDSERWIMHVADALSQHDDHIDGRGLHGRGAKSFTTQALDAIALYGEFQTFLGNDQTETVLFMLTA